MSATSSPNLDSQRPPPPATEPIARAVPTTPRDRKVEGVEVFTPLRRGASAPAHVASAGKVEDAHAKDEHEMHESAEKTDSWAGVYFGVALLAMSGGSYCTYRSWKDRRATLLIPAVVFAVVSVIVGTLAEMLAKKPKMETISLEARNAPPIVPSAFEIGQPVPIANFGNTCFVNAPTQALMNDQRYPHVFKDICEKGKRRNEAYQRFLYLFPKQGFLPSWVSLPSFMSKKKEDVPPLVVTDVRDVLVILSARKGSLDKIDQEFQARYPRCFTLLGQFSAARREAAIPPVADDNAELIAEFTRMKDDVTITTFFEKERSIAAREIAGFNAFLTLINSYETALVREPHIVSFGGWLSSSIGDVRNLMRGPEREFLEERDSQEDVEGFLHCLTKYVRPEDYPDVFFSKYHAQEWAECPVQDQETIDRLFAKHEAHAKPGDILTQLGPDNMTRSIAQPECILTIEDVLTPEADGQVLLRQTLDVAETNSDPQQSSTVFLKNGRARMYYPVRDRFVIEAAPERFILQLKRFEWQHEGRKNKSEVNMPTLMKMCGQEYELQSVVVHGGDSLLGGHYHAMVKTGENGASKWWYASDQQVRSDSIERDVQHALKSGYLYFYVRKAAAAV